MAPDRSNRTWLLSLRVVALYLLVSIIWVPLSDRAVARIADTAAELTRLRTFKGWLWVALTAALLYGLIAQAIRTAKKAHESLASENSHLELVLQQIPAILWTTDDNLIITSTTGGELAAAGWDPNEEVGGHLSERASNSDIRGPVMTAAQGALEGKVSSYVTEGPGTVLDTTVVPLRSDEETIIGVLGLEIDITEARRTEEELVLSIEDLERSNEQRNRLVRHLVEAEQEERDRISAGIHDDSIQVMNSAAMALDLLVSQLDDESSVEIAERARAFTSDAIKGLRSLVFELKPVELERDGLGTALRLLLERSSSEAGFTYDVGDNVKRELPSSTRVSIYKIAKEAIANAGNHAGASKVGVRLEDAQDGIHVTVSDDGRGFDPTLEPEGHHFGLETMRGRAELVGGWCRVSSQPGKGTTVEFLVPVEGASRRSEAS